MHSCQHDLTSSYVILTLCWRYCFKGNTYVIHVCLWVRKWERGFETLEIGEKTSLLLFGFHLYSGIKQHINLKVNHKIKLHEMNENLLWKLWKSSELDKRVTSLWIKKVKSCKDNCWKFVSNFYVILFAIVARKRNASCYRCNDNAISFRAWVTHEKCLPFGIHAQRMLRIN